MYVQTEKLREKDAKHIIFAVQALKYQGFILESALKDNIRWRNINYNFYIKFKQIIVLHISKI